MECAAITAGTARFRRTGALAGVRAGRDRRAGAVPAAEQRSRLGRHKRCRRAQGPARRPRDDDEACSTGRSGRSRRGRAGRCPGGHGGDGSIVGIGRGILLARDRMLEMDGHQRHDAGQLGYQKQPQQPASEPSSGAHGNHANPAPPADISANVPQGGGAEDTVQENSPRMTSPGAGREATAAFSVQADVVKIAGRQASTLSPASAAMSW
jgi:hypothetical protein